MSVLGNGQRKEIKETISRDLIYLSQKQTLLSNPGTKLDSIYYSSVNTTVDLAEVTYNIGRLTISLSNLNFGSQSQLVIPNSSLLEEVYIHFDLPAIIADQTIVRGWGYACIDEISFLFGSSNVSQIRLSGQSLWQTIMLQCETEEKRSEMWRLGGEVQIAPTVGTIEADILLALPWSSASGLYCKKPIDTDLLKNPITINIKFNNARSIYGGIAAPPTTFNQAVAIFKQGNLTNKDQSLGNELMRNPELMYAYPLQKMIAVV